MKTEINSLAAALAYLKIDKKNEPKISGVPTAEADVMIATWQRDTIVKAINKSFNNGKIFKPDFTDGTPKYYIWWLWEKATKGKKAGFRFNGTNGGWSYARTDVGPRLTWVNREAACYFGENEEFVKIYNKSVSL